MRKKRRRNTFRLRKDNRGTLEEIEIMYERNQPDCPTRLIVRRHAGWGYGEVVAGYCLNDDERKALQAALEYA